MTGIRTVSAPRTSPPVKSNGNGHAHIVGRTPYTWELLPADLLKRGKFVLYRNWKGKKLPCRSAKPTETASHADPATWATFELTQAAFVAYPSFDGINAVCSPEFTFVDLDGCITDDQLSEEAGKIIKGLPATYWEVSPSRTGLHGVFHSKGALFLDKRAGSIVEAYSEKHFMSCTGWALAEDAAIGTLRPKDIKMLRDTRAATHQTEAKDKSDSVSNRSGRHSALLRVGGSLVRNGSSMAAVERAMYEYNAEQCHPPLEEKEVARLVRSVAKYKAVGSLLVQETKDIGNADRLLLFGQGDLRYVAAYKCWAVYDGARWPVNDNEQEEVRMMAHTVVRAYGVQAAESHEERHMKFAAESCNSARIANMIREAQPHALLRIAELDRDPLLVNFTNGTLDARTGTLRPHSREDYITAIVPYDYKPKARCPKWLRFIGRTFGEDPKLIAYVRRTLGYSLTGDASEKCMFLANGPTDTGKTTLLAVVSRALGRDYAGRIKVESLMVEGKAMDNNTQSDLADLRGKRFVRTSETAHGQMLREATVKQLIQGQGQLKVARKYERHAEFAETWKIWVDCNHLPSIRDTDDSIWNRLHVIPFAHSVAKKDQNAQLADELMDEAEGILAWIVEGLNDWRDSGLRPPSTVTAQREEWREESDTFKQWLEECFVLTPQAKTASSELYISYKGWYEGRRLFPESTVKFARNMKEHGFQKIEDGDKKVPTWLGIGK